MSKSRLENAMGQLAAMLEERGQTDGELLERFVGQKDEAAFTSLMRRQGAMVLGVCRRVLGNEHDAEDAFQATFLVLARKAATIRPRSRVGNWLYGVAFRTAQEARRATARRRAREAKAVTRDAAAHEFSEELRQVLDQELARLPEQYREIIVLCDLRGQSRKEAARQLSCPEGTIASRLTRARSLLATRLARRGLTASSGALAASLAANSASASLPASLLEATSKLALGKAASGTIPAQVSLLAERVVRTMFLMKLKGLSALVVVVGLLGSGAGWCYHQSAAAQPETTGTAETRPAAPAVSKDNPQRTIEALARELRALQDMVVELKAELAELKRKSDQHGDVLFKGKPASFWLRQLQDRDDGFRVEAVNALGAIGEVDASVIPALVNSLQDKIWRVNSAADVALQRTGKKAVPELIAALRNAHEKRFWIIHALGGFGRDAKAAIPLLVPLLQTGDQMERIAAINALGAIGPDARFAVPALVGFLKDKKSLECCIAIFALGEIGPGAKSAVPALIQLLDEHQAVEFSGVSLGGSDLNWLLPAKLRGTVAYMPDTDAAEALGKIGPAAKAALPALIASLKTSNPSLFTGAQPQPSSPPGGRSPGGRSPGLALNQRVLMQAIWSIDPTAVPPQWLPFLDRQD